MLHQYAPILILLGLIAAFAVGSLVVSDVLGARRRTIG
jgi:NADH:ubiquinone oxidoreductase subunit 3 (subunit A)